MSRFAVATMRKGQPRFFVGRYDTTGVAQGCFAPITTGRPDYARDYEQRAVAELLAELFNAMAGLQAGRPQRCWSVVELPEAWT